MRSPLYQFSVKLHIILTPPNLPLARGRAVGGGVLSMLLHKKLVLDDAYSRNNQRFIHCALRSGCSHILIAGRYI